MRYRRTREQVVADLIDPADAAVYLSARIKTAQATIDHLYSICPEEARELLRTLATQKNG